MLYPINPYRLHLTHAFIMSLANTIVWSALTIYQVQIIGMTPLQLVLAGTTLEITIFLCEIPTGIVADLYSRRLSSVIGFGIIGIGYIVQGVIPLFAAILFGHFLWGLGYTFTSGAYNAWLVDELGQERAAHAFLRGAQVDRFGGLIGIFLGVALGVIALQIPVVIGGALLIGMAVFMAVCMPERGFAPTPAEDRSTWGKMTDTFREGVRVIRRQPVLINILGVGLFFGLFSEGWDRLWQAQLLTTFGVGENSAVQPIVFFGILSVISMIMGIGVTEIVRRRVDTSKAGVTSRVLFWLTAAMVISIIAYGISPTLALALLAFFIFTQARGQIEPLLNIWTNQHIESHVRATVLSMQSQTDAIGQMIGGPPIGLVGNLSLRATFVVSGAILSPALLLLRRAERAGDATALPVQTQTPPESAAVLPDNTPKT